MLLGHTWRRAKHWPGKRVTRKHWRRTNAASNSIPPTSHTGGRRPRGRRACGGINERSRGCSAGCSRCRNLADSHGRHNLTIFDLTRTPNLSGAADSAAGG